MKATYRGKTSIHETENTQPNSILAEIAHGLRAPLHNILSLCYALKTAADKATAEEIYSNLKSEIYRAKMRIDNMLNFHAVGSEGGHLDRMPVDMAVMVADCVDTLRSIAAQRGISISLRGVAKNLNTHADPQMLRLALLNILDNAIKYAYSSTNVVVHVEADASNITVSVEDRGLGIPDESKDRIFEAYWRGARNEHRYIGGTGLGLYAVKRIVDAHKGRISVRSTPLTLASNSSAHLMEGCYLVRFDLVIPRT